MICTPWVKHSRGACFFNESTDLRQIAQIHAVFSCIFFGYLIRSSQNKEGTYMRHAFYNGRVYTGDLPLQEAFLVEDGDFTFVGSFWEELCALFTPL